MSELVAAGPAREMYSYVCIPADDTKPMVELRAIRNTSLEDDDLRDVLRARFSQTALSEEQLEAYCGGRKAQIHAKSPSTEVSESQLLAVAKHVNVDTFAMTVPSKECQEAVSLYCDEKSAVKGLRLNERAIGLAAAIGHADQQFRGDCFVSRYFDDDDAWLRRDFTLADCATDAPWVVAAKERSIKNKSQGGMASLSKMYEQMGAGGGAAPVKFDQREEERKFMEAEHVAESHAWTQTEGDVEVRVPLPNGAKPKVTIARSSLKVAVGADALVDARLFAAVDVDASTWYRDGDVVVVALEKASGGRWDALEKAS